MEDNNNDDTRQGLYDEFESEIVKAHNPEAYFDENDLVEIFDYASDMDNYIVKMEVLLYGARHYPDSQSLATRRAWFYSSLGEMDAAADVNSRVTNGGFLNKLLTLRALGQTDSPELRARLVEIVDESDELLDEDLIQLVDYCAENSMLDWVGENRKRIEAKCTYTPTFIYEYADRAEDAGDAATAQALFEELTMMEPFTVDFWMRLAKVQTDREMDSEALSSVEYALAVDSAYPDALRLKGKLLFRMGHDMEQVTEVFRKVLDSPEATDNDWAIYAASLHELGRSFEAVKILEEVLRTNPLAQSAVDVMMGIDFERAMPYILNIASKVSLTPETITAWAREHISNGHVDEAVNLVSLFSRHFRSTASLGFLAQLYYITRRYNDLINVVRDVYPDGIKDIQNADPAIVYPYLMSLARTGREKEALSEAQTHLNIVESSLDNELSHRAEYILSDTVLPAHAACISAGYRFQLRNIINALSASHPLPPDAYDPHFQ